MTEKHEIVPIEPVQDSQLLLSLKRNDLKFKAYTSLDPMVLQDIVDRILS
ncbi:hypothetical protein [Lactobacillus amylovorus]|nr:hypothetical protein [Lactobacillus amylovorus]MDB6221027.1 hypothetical protein [Lactobacillus amylovorus]